MDLLHKHARIVGGRWRAGRDERAWVRRRTGRVGPDLEPLFRAHWPARTAPPISSCMTLPPPRTSRRRRSLPRSGRSTASTAGGRSGPGCTGSSSTARSTGPAPARCGAEVGAASATPAPSRPRARRRAGGALAELLAGAPGRDRAALLARLHARRDRGAARAPRGTVNSRLRRGLDSLRAEEWRCSSTVRRSRRASTRRRERAWPVVGAAYAARESRCRGRAGTCGRSSPERSSPRLSPRC